MAVAGLSALSDPASSWSRRALGTMLLGALIGWFWLRVARGLREGIDEGDLLAWFLVAFPLFVILINLHPSYLLLTFIAYWQLYAYLRIPAASVGAVVLT
ncbi:MAG: hypothetical protein H0W53_24595, partial [Acidobacteria bacterium]|nr:hypothetical protein [Acidobacteriota bacterium]